MNKSISCLAALSLAAILAVGYTAAQDDPPAGAATPAAARKQGKQADEEAIHKQSREFVQAFNKGDAKAVAAAWSENGEYYDDQGTFLRGRAAIEAAYSELFEERKDSTLEIEVESVRFPSRDTAIEEGVMRLAYAGPEMPVATRYSVLHAREDGEWKVVICREWGAGEHKLDDLAWLIGDWTATSKEREVHLRFSWNEPRTLIENRFSVKEGGVSVASGVQTIRLDPQSGQLRSSTIDAQGGQGDSLWHRDGNRWVLDSVGLLADGGQTTATDVITRINRDEYARRSVDRTLDGEPQPDSQPVKFIRVKGTSERRDAGKS
jgi:uncharacterized protein (TIGR02246 family)